jgi:predicted GIY-YIG superfamily endonuclease
MVKALSIQKIKLIYFEEFERIENAFYREKQI